MENRVIAEIEECLMVSPLKNKFLHMGQLKWKYTFHVKINPTNLESMTYIL